MANNFANDPDVVALYRFESGALTTDSSGNGNTLLDMNTVQNDTTHYKEGSQSAYFQASNTEHFLINDSGSNLSDNFPCKNGTSNNVFSFSAWVRIEEFLPGYIHTIAAKWDSGEGDRSFYFAIDNATKAVRFQLGYNSGNSSEQKNHGSTLSARTWYHVTVCYRDSDKTYAIRVRDANGDVVGSDVETTWSNNINVEDGEFAIGAFYYNSNPYPSGKMNGQIDELVIFNRFLTASEATTIAKGEYGASYEESVSDLMKASDSLSFTKQIPFSLSDLIKVSDSSVNSIKFINLVEDVFKLSEDLRGHLALSFSPSDIAKFSDSSIKSLIIPFLAEDKFLVTDIAIATESGVYYFSVSDIIKTSDSISVRKITSLEVSDVFELSDTGVVKKLSQVDVNDFLNLIDTDSIIKKTLLEVNDRLKGKDSATGIMVDDLSKAAIKLTFRGRTFLVLKERKTFTFKPRISFFTTKKG
jgi:hypothetical protein